MTILTVIILGALLFAIIYSVIAFVASVTEYINSVDETFITVLKRNFV